MPYSEVSWRKCWRSLIVSAVCALAAMGCGSEAGRYTSKSVALSSLAGTWQLTPASVSEMTDVMREYEVLEFFPWQALSLAPDGTCVLKGRIASQSGYLTIVQETVSGTWRVELTTPIYGAKPSSAATVSLYVETKSASGLTHVSVHDLYVGDWQPQGGVERFVLWAYIGDLDARRSQAYLRE